MTKRQIMILSVLGLITCFSLGSVAFLYGRAFILGRTVVAEPVMTPVLLEVTPPSNLAVWPPPSPESPLLTESTPSPAPSPSPVPSPSPMPIISQPSADGIYIVEESGNYQMLHPIRDDSVLDIAALPVVSEKPVFAIKGDDFPLDALVLKGYYAGIGINAEMVSLGSGMGAKIIEVYPNSSAEKAGLVPGEIIFSVNGKPFQAVDFNYALAPYRDLVDLLNPSPITIGVLSDTVERTVTVSRTYRPAGYNFKTERPIPSINFEPMGDYVLLKVTWPLKPGVYRLELAQDSEEKWVFVVR